MTSTTAPSALQKGLPKKTESLCPECGKLVEATIYEKDGKVFMDKECPEHGKFSDIYWSDVDAYLRAEYFAYDGVGLRNPHDKSLAEGENVNFMISGKRVDVKSCTALALIDLTNRCNMNCPICFANANQAGYVYEPSYEEVVAMMEALRAEEPIKCTALQFSGGEPTVHPRLVDIIKKSKELKFAQVQVATNGISFAKNYELLKQCKLAGLNTIYLSFDGVTDDIYLQARDRKMFDIKLKVIENCRRLKEEVGSSPSIVLVPTLVRGVNDHQVGDIVKFAFDNSDVVRGVNFQPVAFTGRITREELEKGRITLTDLVNLFIEQTGYTEPEDWYPVPVVAPVSRFASEFLDQQKVTFTAHPHCGLATYLFKSDDGNVIPMPHFIDVKKFSDGLDELASKMSDSKFKKFYATKVLKLLNKCIDESKIPDGMSKKKFIKMLYSVMGNKSKKNLASFSWRAMYIGAMHFQDSYNYDLARVERCAIHYITPDLKVIPFCAYNGGPEYRSKVEEKFSMPLAEWKVKHKEEAKALEEALVVPEEQKE
ncbi:MAG: tetraether lipid synthase Tes [Candidatus Methanomethylophilaceae archaeon]|jgi:uncharacterized radical SAM superfamily Fe-S cluster-containing enzyme